MLYIGRADESSVSSPRVSQTHSFSETHICEANEDVSTVCCVYLCWAGVRTASGLHFPADIVVLAAGTACVALAAQASVRVPLLDKPAVVAVARMPSLPDEMSPSASLSEPKQLQHMLSTPEVFILQVRQIQPLEHKFWPGFRPTCIVVLHSPDNITVQQGVLHDYEFVSWDLTPTRVHMTVCSHPCRYSLGALVLAT